MSLRPLGKNQFLALQTLVQQGGWPRAWIYDNYSTTIRLLNGLVARGYATVKVTEGGLRADKPGGLVYYHPTVREYRPTDRGKNYVSFTAIAERQAKANAKDFLPDTSEIGRVLAINCQHCHLRLTQGAGGWLDDRGSLYCGGTGMLHEQAKGEGSLT